MSLLFSLEVVEAVVVVVVVVVRGLAGEKRAVGGCLHGVAAHRRRPRSRWLVSPVRSRLRQRARNFVAAALGGGPQPEAVEAPAGREKLGGGRGAASPATQAATP